MKAKLWSSGEIKPIITTVPKKHGQYPRLLICGGHYYLWSGSGCTTGKGMTDASEYYTEVMPEFVEATS